ncbi:hypothetical protein EDD25_2799 [Cryobacterium psychrophilum]|nr:hypothetical protein EDD25_2799 [Cryobacterium psychrophilum]
MSYHDRAPMNGIPIGDGLLYTWTCGDDHQHAIECLYIWHDCQQILGPDTVAPGETFGWRPAGVRAHTLVQADPLTITASVIWPACCGRHGFITDGRWVEV